MNSNRLLFKFLFFSITWFCLIIIPGPTRADNNKDVVIILDTGHSTYEQGAVSARGIGEFHFNRNLSLLLLDELLKRNYAKAMLFIQEDNRLSLSERVDWINRNKPDLLISIHHDSVQPHYLSSWEYNGKKQSYSDLFKGFSIFYSGKNQEADQSLKFARLLGAELLTNGFVPTLHHAENIKGENRDLVDKEKGIYQFDDLIILKQSKTPAVLLECGIIVNRDEEILLSNPVYQRVIILSIANAIDKFTQ